MISKQEIELIRAGTEHEPIVANLLQLYAHDFSEFHNVLLGTDGRFVYKDLPLYFREPTRNAFLVKHEGKWAGFVLVQRGSQISDDAGVWDMTEFFVLRAYRRRRIGTEIAHEVWRNFPGKWEVRVMEANLPAKQFWKRALKRYTGAEIASVRLEKDGSFWQVFSFYSSASR